MDTISAAGFETCCAAIVGDMARALAERDGETPEQQFARAQAAVHMIMGFLPRDAVEAILASHCVMFHELMAVTARDALRTPPGKAQRDAVHGIIAQNKGFCGNLARLRYYQTRPAERSRDAPEVAPCRAGPVPAAEREQSSPVGTAQAASPVASEQTVQPRPVGAVAPQQVVSAPANASAVYRPTADGVASCQANPTAATALRSGDAAGFARAMGIRQPSAAFLAAASAEGSPFDPKASGPWPETPRLDKAKA